MIKELSALWLGAGVGATARWQLGVWLNPGQAHQLPWGTWVANACGAYLIGLGVTVLQHHPHIDPAWRLLLITGFLGALTTFSTFSMETVSLLAMHKWGLALGNVGANVLGSLLLTYLGWLSGEWWLSQTGWASPPSH